MSEPIFEASVRLRVDDKAFEQQAKASVNRVATEVEQKTQAAMSRADSWAARDAARARAQADLDARRAADLARREAEAEQRRRVAEQERQRIQPEVDAQLRSQTEMVRSQTAGLVGDEAARLRHEREAFASAADAAALTQKRTAEDLMKQAKLVSGGERELLIATAQNAVVASRMLEKEAARIRLQGLGPDPTIPPGGRGGGLGGLLGGRSGGLPGLISTGARFGLAGFAFTAAFNGLSELQRRLETTGAEALTTEGRLRNVGSALLRGDLVSGITALTKSASSVEELGINADNAEEKLKALEAVAHGTARAHAEAAEKTDDQSQKLETATHAYGRFSAAAAIGVAGTNEYTRAVAAAGTANEDLASQGAAAARAIIEQTNAMLAFLPVALQFRDAAGNIILNPFGQQPGPFPANAPPGNFGSLPGVSYPSGLQAFGTLQNQLSAAQRAGDDRAAKAIADRLVEIARDRLRVVEERVSQPGLSPERRAFLKNLERTRNQELQAALDVQDQIGDQIAAQGKSAKEKADQIAKTNRENAIQARELALENNIAAALLTKSKADDKKFFAEAIAYYKSVARSADTALEREQAQAKVIELRKRRTEALSGGGGEGNDLRLLRIENNIAAAQLTTGLADDKKWINALVAYWREQMKLATGYEKEVARGRFIAAQLQRQALNRQGGESPEVFAQALFQRAVDEFNRFGSNISGSANGILSPQDARGAFARSLGGGRFGTGAYQERIQEEQLTEQQKQTRLLQRIAQNGSTSPRKAPIAPDDGAVGREIGVSVVRGM